MRAPDLGKSGIEDISVGTYPGEEVAVHVGSSRPFNRVHQNWSKSFNRVKLAHRYDLDQSKAY